MALISAVVAVNILLFLPIRIRASAAYLAGVLIALATFLLAVWKGAHRQGRERWWRVLLGCSAITTAPMAGEFLCFSLRNNSAEPSPAQSVLYLASFVLTFSFVLAALLALPSVPRFSWQEEIGTPADSYRWRTVIVLDSLILVGSAALLAQPLWLPQRHLEAASLTFMVGATLVLVVVAVLMVTFRRPRSPPTAFVIGTGLAATAISAAVFRRLVVEGSTQAYLVTVGFNLTLVLYCLAIFMPPPPEAPPISRAQPTLERFHGLLPYVALSGVGIIVFVDLAQGTASYAEILALLVLGALALIRQMFTLAEVRALATRLHISQQQLHYQALHDPLTGAANRALFLKRLEEALARQTAGQQPDMALMFVDLDDFKKVNDTMGHAAGDRLLCVAADRLRGAVRPTDTIARLGGDEFAVLLGGGEPAEGIGQRLMSRLRAPCEVEGTILTIGASVGLVIPDATNPPPCAESLLRAADSAMYVAKRTRKGRLVVHRHGGGPAGQTAEVEIDR